MEKFKLKDFLKADLIRASLLTKDYCDESWKLWINILSPRFIPVLIYRISFFLQDRNLSILAKIFSLINVILFGIEISSRCRIGKGMYLPHTHGTVIGASEIGANSIIFQGVTLGAKNADFSYKEDLRPKIGDNVTIGAGAKVLGGIFLGENSKIGANAVVLIDVPANSLAVGIPAKIIDLS